MRPHDSLASNRTTPPRPENHAAGFETTRTHRELRSPQFSAFCGLLSERLSALLRHTVTTAAGVTTTTTTTKVDTAGTEEGVPPTDFSAELAKIAEVKAAQPDNIGIQCFDLDYFNSLTPDLQARMIACARSGFENPDSGMGAYAIQPDDYVRSIASGALARDPPPPPPPVAIDLHSRGCA
eukprot:COSAG06_NODE_7593_length_2448_cov_9.736484_3_plen_181_part_00